MEHGKRADFMQELSSPTVCTCRDYLSEHAHAPAYVVQGDVVCLLPKEWGKRIELATGTESDEL